MKTKTRNGNNPQLYSLFERDANGKWTRLHSHLAYPFPEARKRFHLALIEPFTSPEKMRPRSLRAVKSAW
jgi:hypothetical protein